MLRNDCFDRLRAELGDRFDEYVLDLTENWAPRVGVIWDFARNGRSKLFANYGRFYESIPMDINIRAFGGGQSNFFELHRLW